MWVNYQRIAEVTPMQCTAEVIIHRVHAQKICKIVDFVLYVQNHRYISRRLRRYSNKSYSNSISFELHLKYFSSIMVLVSLFFVSLQSEIPAYGWGGQHSGI